MSLSRRDLLKSAAGAAALWASGSRTLCAVASTKKIPIGLQLYSVRKECAQDLPRVLAAVSKMGYQGVEFAGYHGRTASELRKMLDDNGLACCGTHTAIDTLLGDNFKKTVEFHKTLGNKHLIVPWLPEKYRESAKAWRATAKRFDELAAKAKEVDMRVGYHAHACDFKKHDGTTGWDIFFGGTTPDVVMQLDTGNCMGGGEDPVAVLKRFPGRAITVHLKEHGGKPGAPIGEGDVPWAKVFEACETIGGTQWYVVEHETGKKPIDSVVACLKNLRGMGK